MILMVLILFNSRVYSQEDQFQWKGDWADDIDSRVENENGYKILAEERDETRQRPVDLNSATNEEINCIPYLNALQRKNLSDYLKTYGEIFSVYELISVSGFDSALLLRIMPYIRFNAVSHSPPLTLKNLFKYSRNQLLVRVSTSVPRSNGYAITGDGVGAEAVSTYPGNPYGFSLRYTYTFGERLSIGFSGDKDPGEQFFKGGQKYGMDYYSGYLCYSGKRILKRLIIGNFRAGWGLGLTFNTGGAIGMYPGFNQEFSVAGGIRPTQTVSESGVLRGVAVSLGTGRLTFNGIFSLRRRDATVTVSDSVTGRAEGFSSFVETGYHRTIAELDKKGRVQEMLYGGNLSLRGNFFSVGVSGYSVKLSANLQPRPDLYNMYTFSGSENFVLGADINLFYRFMRFSGEVSRSRNGSMAFLAGVSINPDPRFSAVLLYRNYPPGYQNLYSGGFGQNSSNSNERGWYLSMAGNLPLHLTLNVFADFCYYPWAKYLLNRPSGGTELGAQLLWQLNKSLNFMVRCTYSASGSSATDQPEMVLSRGRAYVGDLRFNINWLVKESLYLQSRIEIKRSGSGSNQGQYGWLLFQDVCLNPAQSRFKIVFRYSVFDCPLYETRIWAYEPDMLYAYSMPVFYGKGSRICALIKFYPGKHFVFYLKSALTKFTNREVIGSGNDQVSSSWKLDLACELLFRI